MKRLTMALCALIAMTACSSSTEIRGTTGGTFALQTVNGGDLPAIVSQQGTSMTQATAGSISLNEGHLYQRTLTLRSTVNGTTTTTTETESGTWNDVNGALTLTANGGATLLGTLLSNAITVAVNGAVYVYRQ